MDNLNKIINIKSRKHFNEILQKYPNVVVDFTASWCGCCHYLKPILKRINSEIEAIQIITIDVDKHVRVSDEYKIMGVPTLLAFKNGKLLTGELEEQDYAKLKKEIKKTFKL